MAVGFRTCRRLLSGLMAFISCISIILSVYLLPRFSHTDVDWTIMAIQIISFVRCIWSTLRKTLFNTPQTVASEMIGLVILLPFQLVLVLLSVAVPFRQQTTIILTFNVMQAFILFGTAIHTIYTTALFVTALVTVYASDREVWYRDIDSSPSPFPISDLMAFVFPCLSRHSTSTNLPTQSSLDEHDRHEPTFCLPGCNCTTKLRTPRRPTPGMASVSVSSGSYSVSKCTGSPAHRLGGPNSLSRSLVRVPNAAERRVAIVVAFDV